MSKAERKSFLLSRAAARGMLAAASLVAPSVRAAKAAPCLGHLPLRRYSDVSLSPSERDALKQDVAQYRAAHV